MSGVIEDTSYEKNFFVHLSDAQARKACVDDVSYHVDLALPKGDWFGGKVKVSFKFKSMPPKQQ